MTEIKYPTRLLDRAFSILELLSTRSKPLSLAEISAEAELDKATAYRILTNLVRRNYVHRNEDTKAYTLGYGIFRLARHNLALSRARIHARPFLARLSADLRLHAELGAIEGHNVQILETLSRHGASRPLLTEGAYVEAHACAMGKALLSVKPENAVARLYDGYVLHRHTGRTLVNFGALQAELRHVRTQGYAVDNQERETHHISIGAPLVTPAGGATLALSVTGFVAEVEALGITPVGKAVVDVAQAIAAYITSSSD